MALVEDQLSEEGVYCSDTDGSLRLVHRYQGGDYRLEDIVDYFDLGTLDSDGDQRILVLTASDLRELKMMVDAYSFDYEEGFVEMCLQMHRFAASQPVDELYFIENSENL